MSLRDYIGMANRLGNRRSNQDRFSVRQRNDTLLMVLADGLGGHPRGELAAELITKTLAHRFREADIPITSPDDFLMQGLLEAHQAIIKAGQEEQPPVHPRTTCVACIAQADQVWWCHVGDSRLYLVRGNKLVARTRDHSRVEYLLEQGLIEEREVNRHPELNRLTQSVGGDAIPPLPGQGHARLQQGDRVLLCSDGLWSALHEREILAILSQHSVTDAADLLADAAEAASYPNSDNITLLTLSWPIPSCPDTVRSRKKGGRSPGEDPSLDSAIQHVQNALNEYADELKGK